MAWPRLPANCATRPTPGRDESAGLPRGVVSIIPGDRATGEHLVRHPGVDKVSITGSTAAGKRVMELCAGRIARVTLELGGKSAAIIADDVPVENVVPSLIPGSIGFSGQVCAALTRVLVFEQRHDEVVETLANVFNAIPVGDHSNPPPASDRSSRNASVTASRTTSPSAAPRAPRSSPVEVAPHTLNAAGTSSRRCSLA